MAADQQWDRIRENLFSEVGCWAPEPPPAADTQALHDATAPTHLVPHLKLDRQEDIYRRHVKLKKNKHFKVYEDDLKRVKAQDDAKGANGQSPNVDDIVLRYLVPNFMRSQVDESTTDDWLHKATGELLTETLSSQKLEEPFGRGHLPTDSMSPDSSARVDIRANSYQLSISDQLPSSQHLSIIEEGSEQLPAAAKGAGLQEQRSSALGGDSSLSPPPSRSSALSLLPS